MKYGYARVSSHDQDASIQIAELIEAGVHPEFIRAEKKSGKSLEGRDELALLRQFMRSGDELWVSRLDRLARNVHDVSVIVKDFEQRGIVLHSIHEQIDLSTAPGKAFVQMLAIIGELDYSMRRERQLAGISKAKLDGVYANRRPGAGRKPKITDVAAARQLMKDLGTAGAARRLGVDKTTLLRTVERNSPNSA